MVKKGCMALYFLFGLVPMAWADVLVLEGYDYIDRAKVIKNDQGMIIYQKDQKLYRIGSREIIYVAKTVPSKGKPYQHEELIGGEPGTQSQAAVGTEGTNAITGTAEHEGLGEAIGTSGKQEKKRSVTIGILQGGGSLVGADFEFLLGDSNLAFQFGGGLIGLDAGFNYHFEPTVHSCYISLGVWNQGLFANTYTRWLGLTFGLRAFKALNAQLGVGYIMNMSQDLRDAMTERYGQLPPAALLYCIGIYF